MQPIIVFAIAGVAAIALGTGFLNNDIDLWIQDFGVGAGDIETPVDHAIIDFNIVQLADENTGFYKNRINYCLVTLDEPVGTTTNPNKLSEITCKITGKNPVTWEPNGQVIAEGKLCALTFNANEQFHVPLGQASGCPANTPPVLGPLLVDPKEAGDVILIVHANTYNNGMTLPPP